MRVTDGDRRVTDGDLKVGDTVTFKLLRRKALVIHVDEKHVTVIYEEKNGDLVRDQLPKAVFEGY